MLMKLLTMQHKIMKMVCKMSAKDAYLSQTLFVKCSGSKYARNIARQ